MKSAFAIINARLSQEIQRWLEAHPEIPRETVDRSQPNSLEAALKKALSLGSERLLLFGGDGTVNRVVNFLIARRKIEKMDIALVAAGTCNDLARFMKSPKPSPENADKLLTSGRIRLLDVGRCNNQYFVNNAGFGRDFENGKASVSALKSALRLQPRRVKITSAGKLIFEGEIILMMACNGPHFNHGLHFSRAARADDHLLEFYCLKPISRMNLLWRLAKGRLGIAFGERDVFSLRAEEASVYCDESVWPQADGEPPREATRKVEFSIAKERLRWVYV